VPEVARGSGGQILTSVYNASANSIVPGSAPAIASDVKNVNGGDGVIHDITGTTVYVVAVICVIPVAGLVAWVVRYVVKKKDILRILNSENCSETGLNCAITRNGDDGAGVGGSGPVGGGNGGVGGHQGPLDPTGLDLDINDNESETDHRIESVKESLSNSAWQFSRQNLRLLTVLGEGNFGRVWKAEAQDIAGYSGTLVVAVKTSKENAPEKEKSDLIQEMKIMQQIGGTHPNIVTLLGICTDKDPCLLILEYVKYGKLLTHLREQRGRDSLFDGLGDPAGDINLLGDDDSDDGRHGHRRKDSGSGNVTAKDLTKYAYGVAKGMEFLGSKGIIHRDIAARNILLDHNRVCKISDFGLSRNLADTGSEMYEQKTKGALPIRWMAPESLYFSVFTPKSDVWSFGILMWEIVTLGSTPYPGMGAREVMRRVRDGYRLERPGHCHPELYKIIAKCWAGDMNKRPDFTELRQGLAKLLEDQHGYIDLLNIPENKYFSMSQSPGDDDEEKI